MLKIKSLKTTFGSKRLLALLGLVFLMVMSMIGPLSAQNVVQGYGADTVLERGTIVATKTNDPNKVEAASIASANRLLGVVVNASDAPATVSAGGDQTFVATTGHFEVIVSDQNGAIKAGDYIVISAADGVGMKVNDEQTMIIGQALGEFDGKTSTTGTKEIQEKGKSREINLGRVLADIKPAANPLAPQSSALPSFLKKASQGIAGKPVSTGRAYLALAIFVIGSITAGITLYTGVRSSIISIGRNPLSKKIILRGLVQITFTSVAIFLVSLIGVYLLLKI